MNKAIRERLKRLEKRVGWLERMIRRVWLGRFGKGRKNEPDDTNSGEPLHFKHRLRD
jgi:hypothetical protein